MKLRRLLAIVGGSLILVAGTLLVVVSCSTLVLESDCATTGGADASLSSTTSAVVVFSTALESQPYGGLFCEAHDRLEIRVEATPARGKDLFLGLAPVDAVVDYLDVVVHDRAQISTLFGVSYRRLPSGVKTPQSLKRHPAQQTFWSARATESDGTLVLTETRRLPGHYALVLANADGSPGVAADTSWQLTSSPKTDPLPVLFLLLGLAALVGGTIVVVRGGRGHAARGSSSTSPDSNALNASDS